MHKNNNNIKILNNSFSRNNIYRFFWSFNLLLVLGYMGMSYLTVSNIIERKQISINIENMRADIGNLESEYFTKMAIFGEESNLTEGYDEPEYISFAKIKSASSVSLANENGS